MRPVVPPIKVAHHEDLAGSGSPYRKVRTLPAIGIHKVSAEFFVQAIVTALVEEIEVLVGEKAYIMTGRSDGVHGVCAPNRYRNKPLVYRSLRIHRERYIASSLARSERCRMRESGLPKAKFAYMLDLIFRLHHLA